jgi:hypothetical protein
MGSSEQAELVGPGLVAGSVERSLSVTGNFGAGSGSGALMKGSRFAADSMLEGAGFEPSIGAWERKGAHLIGTSSERVPIGPACPDAFAGSLRPGA